MFSVGPRRLFSRDPSQRTEKQELAPWWKSGEMPWPEQEHGGGEERGGAAYRSRLRLYRGDLRETSCLEEMRGGSGAPLAQLSSRSPPLGFALGAAIFQLFLLLQHRLGHGRINIPEKVAARFQHGMQKLAPDGPGFRHRIRLFLNDLKTGSGDLGFFDARFLGLRGRCCHQRVKVR